jgi:hypothetical protein
VVIIVVVVVVVNVVAVIVVAVVNVFNVVVVAVVGVVGVAGVVVVVVVVVAVVVVVDAIVVVRRIFSQGGFSLKDALWRSALPAYNSASLFPMGQALPAYTDTWLMVVHAERRTAGSTVKDLELASPNFIRTTRQQRRSFSRCSSECQAWHMLSGNLPRLRRGIPRRATTWSGTSWLQAVWGQGLPATHSSLSSHGMIT